MTKQWTIGLPDDFSADDKQFAISIIKQCSCFEWDMWQMSAEINGDYIIVEANPETDSTGHPFDAGELNMIFTDIGDELAAFEEHFSS